jgi:methenyltetrahydromethanopterin cyclohydrolase
MWNRRVLPIACAHDTVAEQCRQHKDRIYITIGPTASLGFIMNLNLNANIKEILATAIA